MVSPNVLITLRELVFPKFTKGNKIMSWSQNHAIQASSTLFKMHTEIITTLKTLMSCYTHTHTHTHTRTHARTHAHTYTHTHTHTHTHTEGFCTFKAILCVTNLYVHYANNNKHLRNRTKECTVPRCSAIIQVD